MKNRIEQTPLTPPHRTARLWLNEVEWSQIEEAVPANKRIKVPIDLELTPLQHRALMWLCKTLFVTPSEFVTSALVTDLDGHNNASEEAWLAGSINGVLAQFPEREKDLGELCNAINAQSNAVRGAGRFVDAERAKLAARGLAVTV